MFTNKSLIVITGASSGIGEAIARKFSQEGYPLLLLSRRYKKLMNLNLPNTICAKIDVTDLVSFKKAIDEAQLIYGDVGCIINNAGVMFLGRVEKQNPKEWQAMINTNIIGVINGINSVLQNMINKKSGTIINISSVVGRKTAVDHAIYCATKHAVHALSESIREEISNSNVRVITISPGVVNTELINKTSSAELKENYRSWKESMKCILKPMDIAEIVFFAYVQPQRVCIREIIVAPTPQEK
jgi:NADP-dependent 3-hydroxy acid dehydrogenase YdfG